MKFIFALPVIFLFGCSSVPQRPEIPECTKVASYARTVSILRGMGIKENDLDPYTNVPIAVTFPYKMVREEVYYMKTTNPAEVFAMFYDKCYQAGYPGMLQVLKDDEVQHQEDLKKEAEEKRAAEIKKAVEAAAAVQAAREKELNDELVRLQNENKARRSLYKQYGQ